MPRAPPGGVTAWRPPPALNARPWQLPSRARKRSIEWDAKELKATNAPEVTHIVKPEYRAGYTLQKTRAVRSVPNRFSRFREGEAPAEPSWTWTDPRSLPARQEPRPPRITQGDLGRVRAEGAGQVVARRARSGSSFLFFFSFLGPSCKYAY